MQPLNRPQIKKFLKNVQPVRKDIEIVFVLQSLENPANVGHFFRLADAVGAKEIVLTGRTPAPPNPDIELTAMRQDRRIPFRVVSKVEDAISSLKSNGYQIVSVELTEKSVSYDKVEYPAGSKVAIVVGNERSGVYPSVLSRSDNIVYIPMYGKNYSLNVHVAGAIIAYSVLQR